MARAPRAGRLSGRVVGRSGRTDYLPIIRARSPTFHRPGTWAGRETLVTLIEMSDQLLGFPINGSSARNELHPCLLVEVIGVVEGPGHGDIQVASRPFIDGVGSPRADHGVGESPRR